MNILVFILIGAIAGWLAGQLMKGSGFGLVTNIIIGVVGSFIGGFVLGLIGLSFGGFIGSVVSATVGAVLLLFLAGLVKK